MLHQSFCIKLCAVGCKVATPGVFASSQQAVWYVLGIIHAGPVVRAALKARGHDLTEISAADVLKMPVAAAVNTSELFSTFFTTASSNSLQLDLHALLAEIEHGVTSSSNVSQQEASNAEATQPPAAAVKMPAAAVEMPVPEQLQPLLNVSAADSAAAEVRIISDQQEEQQHAKELSDVAQHLSAARVTALDVEYSWETTVDSSTDSSTDSSLDEDYDAQLTYEVDMPAEHHRFQQQSRASPLRVALLSLMVPAVETESNAWPAAIYLIQVQQQAAAAQQVFSQLLPQLEDEGIIKVAHDARQVCGQGPRRRLNHAVTCAMSYETNTSCTARCQPDAV
jgi:hypothetical protein